MHRSARLLLLLALAALAFLWSASAQERLLSPEAFLGYELGQRFTPHHRVLEYAAHVADASPRVEVQSYGETYEGRPLVLLTIAAPERLARLDALRQDNLRRAGLLDGTPAADAPAIVWLSYNVHGNEAVSSEAALLTLHALADPANAQTSAWLDSVVVLLDPMLNPDGRERYVGWYRRTRGAHPNASPDAREHAEPWPGGRTNHYYFDLNRDWAWATQQETQARLDLYNRWMPHVHVDFHEQGVEEPYYFAPAAEPFHAAITDWQRRFQTTIGQNNARYFDAEGWLYFTREVFDLLYPSYGDTWPTFNGAVGMTYEQGGSGRAGLAIETAEGDTLTLRDRILHHHTTGLSTVETAARNRAEVLREFERYFQNPPETPYRAVVVKPGPDGRHRDRLDALMRHLDRQGLRYDFARGGQTVRADAFGGDASTTVAVEAGDLVVPFDQPKAVLARVLFEPDAVLADSLTYDITAWALPFTYQVEAYAAREAVAVGGDPVPVPASLGAGVARPYAYLIEWESFADARLLADLLQAGVKVRAAGVPFSVEGRTFERGTLVVTRRGNEGLGEGLDARVREAAAAHGQPVHAVTSGMVTSGGDFGSSAVAFLGAPRVAVLAGDAVSPYALGEVWHYFDQQLGYPATLIDADTWSRVDWGDYDVLVLPSGGYGDVLTEARLGELRAWVRGGGRLIAMEAAASFLAGKDGFGLQPKSDPARADDANPDSTEDRLRRYADRERVAISDDIPGAIYRLRFDATHPLGFGFGDHYDTLTRGTRGLAFLEDGWNVGVMRDGAPVAGFAGAAAQRRLADTLVFGVEEMGRGAIVYMADDPLFRGFWYGGKLLFANAVFFVGQG